MIDQSKRSLFQNLKNHAVRAQDVKRLFLRPPTAIAEKDFLETCTGCGECVTACPRNIIFIHNYSATLNLELNYCDHCNLCSQKCPTGALSSTNSIVNLRPKFTSNCDPKIAYYCKECAEVCQTNAITIEKNQSPQLSIEHCNGCNQCTIQCPNSAINIQLIN